MNLNLKRKKFLNNQKFNKWCGFGVLFLFFGLFLYSYNYIVKELRAEEQKNVETIVKALEVLSIDKKIDHKTQALALKIIENNTTIPLILISENGDFTFQRNFDKIENQLEHDPVFLDRKITSMAKQHQPINVNLPFGSQKIYFENSSLLSQLKYYPFIIIIVTFLFAMFSLWYFKVLENSRRGLIWAGLAKETAHQIGTPLSSLLGWIELLKMENLSDDITVKEMERDIQRLNQIANRFSQIGSDADLMKQDIVEACTETFNYLYLRMSSQIKFKIIVSEEKIDVEFNRELFSWVLENLVKNAVDAMQNKGKVTLKIQDKDTEVYICVSDTGTGLSSRQKKHLFEPGFTTKTRGWGLGLTFAKRIIEDYHHGKIFVLKTNEKGTIFQIILPKNKPQKKGFLDEFKNLFND